MKGRLRSLATNLAVLAGSLLLFAVVVEIGLRLSGFSFVLYPEEIEFGAPQPELPKPRFREDDDVFWVTPDYREKLEDLRRERPALVFMGDSCTDWGHYDAELVDLVEERRGTRIPSGNLGVAGWTSYQGLRQLERDVVPLGPRVVTIYYGWNDHWISFGIEDKNVARIKKIFKSRYSGLRWVQLFTKALVVAGSRETNYPNRVSLDDFRANLLGMVERSREAGIRPVLLTAPTSIREGEEPEHLASRWLRKLEDLVPLHRAYADTVREVASAEGVALCDLEARFTALGRSELEAAFRADGTHLTDEGDRRLAGFLYECFDARDSSKT